MRERVRESEREKEREGEREREGGREGEKNHQFDWGKGVTSLSPWHASCFNERASSLSE